MPRIIYSLFLVIISSVTMMAADPTATSFSYSQCAGSAMPYPEVTGSAEWPDSLTPVFINHVGRHGARYPASAKGVTRLMEALDKAEEAKTITPTGRKLRALAKEVEAATAGQWGALDSLGMAEERGIASRMMKRYPDLFSRGRVDAISSYAPRCIMSMYTFTHQMARLNNRLEISTASGRQFSWLLRPFDTDNEYKLYREGAEWQKVLDKFNTSAITLKPLEKALGSLEGYTAEELSELAMDEYRLVAGTAAMGIACKQADFFTTEEYNKLWTSFNLKQYLLYSANTVSSIPADMASPLVMNLISTTDSVIAHPAASPVAILRFGHAETLMPLLSLMRLKGAYYMTNYFETVATHWQDFNIVPMASNLQMILFVSKKGNYYVRVELNEKPIPLMPGSEEIYIPWTKARDYLNRCIPIFYQ